MPGDLYCVVPTFAPEPAVVDRIANLAGACPVLAVDDASPCTSDPVLRQVEATPNVEVIRHAVNVGIGRSLNSGLKVAREAGCTWLLTVDQDTEVPTGFIPRIVKAARLLGLSGVPLGALGAGEVNIAGATMRYPGRTLDFGGLLFLTTEEVIQSATLWNVEAMTSIGGFNESFGMDAVDAHACLRLRERGLVVAALPGIAIEHRLGSAQSVNVRRDRPVFITGHSPQRRTTMLRNRLTLFPDEFRQSPRHAVRTLRRVLVNQLGGLVLEGDSWAKLRGSMRGLMNRSTR